MRPIKFPKMFNTNGSNVWASSEYDKSTAQNAQLLLNTERGEQFGDPYIGCKIKGMTFDQNNYILEKVLIDNIYEQLAIFIPQLKFNRNDIQIIKSDQKGKIICKVSGISQIDYSNSTYNLVLFEESDS